MRELADFVKRKLQHPRFWSVGLQQLNLKDQRGTWRDHTTSAVVAVAKVGREDQLAFVRRSDRTKCR